MVNIITVICKYIILFFIALFTLTRFALFMNKSDKAKNRIINSTNFMIFIVHLSGFIVVFLNIKTTQVLVIYGIEVLYLLFNIHIYPLIYKKCNKALISNMCMLIAIGFVLLIRLKYDKAVKQLMFVIGSTVITLIIPIMIKKIKDLSKYKWLYCFMGIALLGSVLALGVVSRGAKLGFTIGGISIQPSEFVKIIFVFFIASYLCNSTTFKDVIVASIFAASFVLILVMSTDLGSALIFFIVYAFMLYVATKKLWYIGVGFGAFSLASVLAYFKFSHIRVRVTMWLNPWSDPKNKGYQVIQSMFAIGTGGWFGTGLYKGMPTSIPIVEKDFIFAAISEEMGGIVAISIIVLCLSTFVIMIQVGKIQTNNFYKLLALGLGISYAFQIFLTIGGTMKMIPLTGVTLPLISYGGSSMVSTMIVFSIIQGLHIREKEVENEEEYQAQLQEGRNKYRA